MRALADAIDRLNVGIGRVVAWLTLFMVVTELVVVLGRYVFGLGSVLLQEGIVYMHALLFMLAAAYTLGRDGHVRVDIFYREARPRTKAIVNLFGAILLVLPVCALIVITAWSYVGQSWAILERSKETSGIPLVFLLKTVILVFAATVGLQGFSMAIRSVLAIRGDAAELRALTPEDVTAREPTA